MRTRRVLLQVHLWTGLITGLYICVVSITGTALVFRIHVQRAAYPALFTPGDGPALDPATLMERIAAAYPAHRLSGIEMPTSVRPTVLAYATSGATFETILANPADGRILGTLPEVSIIRRLQNLHFDLLAGRTGRLVNGIGALCLLLMTLTGAIVWAFGSKTWHGRIGVVSLLLLAMWSLTGASFAFPRATRAIVGSLSPLTVPRTPISDLSRKGVTYPGWRELIATAIARVPDQHVARVVTPYSDTAPFLVMFSASAPTPVSGAALTPIYLDQYTGDVLQDTSRHTRTAGDAVMAWLAPLHIGNFGGTATRLIWAMAGLAPAFLFVTGFRIWWLRVCRNRY